MAADTPENPYIRLPLAFAPRTFYGSPRLVQQLVEGISAAFPQDFELIGLPGMGKSTLLRYLADPAGAFHQHREKVQEPFRSQPERLFPLLVEFRHLPTGEHPFMYLYRRLVEDYSAYRRHLPASIAQTAPELPPKSLASEKPDLAADALEQNLRSLAALGIRPVLLLDDFDLAFEKLTWDQATRLRPWRDAVSFLLVTERPLHQVNPKAAGSPFYQTIPLIRLGGLSEDEARRVIVEPARTAGINFPAEDIDLVLQVTDGHPYLLILAGQVLWETRKRLGLLEKQTPLSKEQQSVLRGRLLAEFSGSFHLYWERLELQEREALDPMANPEQKSLREPRYAALASLELKGLVKYERDTGYTPFSPLFADFLHRTSEPVPQPRPEPTLTDLEAALYAYLRRYADRTCTFEELSQAVWHEPMPSGKAGDLMRRRIQVTVSRLRKKLQETTGEDVLSAREQGYRFVARGAEGTD